MNGVYLNVPSSLIICNIGVGKLPKEKKIAKLRICVWNIIGIIQEW